MEWSTQLLCMYVMYTNPTMVAATAVAGCHVASLAACGTVKVARAAHDTFGAAYQWYCRRAQLQEVGAGGTGTPLQPPEHAPPPSPATPTSETSNNPFAVESNDDDYDVE